MSRYVSQSLNYRHRIVRDLAWSCFSPLLMSQLPGSDATLLSPAPDRWTLDWLSALDQNPAPLQQALDKQPQRRLGLYFEQLIAFYLSAHPEWDLLAHNRPVTLHGRTQGAFDFLCRYGAQHWHLELAVKFYLGRENAENPSDWDQWLGPNANDRLDLKLNRLAGHQLPLSAGGVGKAWLDDWLGETVTWHPGLIIKGYFFYPVDGHRKPPQESHPDHLRGQWQRLSPFLEELEDNRWRPLARNEWLAHASGDAAPWDKDELVSFLREQVLEGNRAQLLVDLTPERDQRHETGRRFVVPDHWPDK